MKKNLSSQSMDAALQDFLGCSIAGFFRQQAEFGNSED